MFKKIQLDQLISFKPTKNIEKFEQANIEKIEHLINFMKTYDEISDYYLGFERFQGEIDDKDVILRRLNPEVEINKSKSLIANQKVFLANRILGAKKVFEAEGRDIKKDDDLIEIFNKFNKKLDNFPEKNLEKNLSNFKLNLESELHILAKNSRIKDFSKKLAYASGFVLLEFEQKIIITETTADNNLKLFSVDQPIQPFSSEIQKDLEANSEDQKWFTKLSEFEKNLVKSHKDKLFSNQHVLSKNLSNIPGLKNAFLRQDFLIKNENALISSSENLHMASPAPEIKNPQIQELITTQNISHLNETFGQISICSLLDQSEMKKSEKKQTNAMKKAIENHNSNTTTTKPIIFSPLGISILSKLSITENLKEMGRVTSNLLEKVTEKEGIDNEKKEFQTLGDQIKSQIKNLEGRGFVIDKLIRNILEILRFIMGFDFKENQQMKLQTDFNKMINLYNQDIPDEEKFLVSINCKSGEDRTGVIQQIFSAQSLIENNNNDNGIQPEEIKNLVKKSEHVEYINGSVYGGNSASAKGVLPHTKTILNPEYREFFGENFFPKTSSSGKVSSKILKNQIEIKKAEGLANPNYPNL